MLDYLFVGLFIVAAGLYLALRLRSGRNKAACASCDTHTNAKPIA